MDFGKKCEEIVYKYEINRLINEGRQEEAKNVKWISRDIGDGYGYDIEASENLKDRYYIYRVGKANTKNPEFYKIRGNVRDNFELETKVYLARVKENKKY